MLSEKLKKTSNKAIDNAAEELKAIADSIWNKPELNYQEHHAHDLLTKFLTKKGFHVEEKYKLETAFRAEYKDGKGPGKGANVALLCEYDALPNMGHACGHNLIAEVGVAAAIGIQAAMKHSSKTLGKLTVLGTPAEEGGGGKIHLIEAGAFKDIDVAMMAHPGPGNSIENNIFVATKRVPITFRGKASHAAAFPWEGVNALDAAVLTYSNVAYMRQQLKPGWLIHGIISKGGTKPNIIPELSEMQYQIRASNRSDLELLEKKVMACAEGAAEATGCQAEIPTTAMGYYDLQTNTVLAGIYKSNAKTFDLEFHQVPFLESVKGSTDMGNVSYIVPSIHPVFYIGSNAVNHTRDFAHASGHPGAQVHVLKQAKILAMTAIDVFCQPELVDKMKEQLLGPTAV